MSVHLAGPVSDNDHQSGSSDEDDNDDNWDDFAEDSIAQQPCVSLFEDKTFPSVTEALENDKSKYNFDIDKLCSRISAYFIDLHILPIFWLFGLDLDFHQRIRLVNYIRKNVRSIYRGWSSFTDTVNLLQTETITSRSRIIYRSRRPFFFRWLSVTCHREWPLSS